MFGLKPQEEQVILRQRNVGLALRIMQLAAERHGVTCDECISLLGRPHQTVSARFSELVRSGCLAATGRYRETRQGGRAQVHAVPRGALFGHYIQRRQQRPTRKRPQGDLTPLDQEVLGAAYAFMRKWPTARRRDQEKLILRLVHELGDRLAARIGKP